MRKYFVFGLIFILLAGALYNTYAQPMKNINRNSVEMEELLLQTMEVGDFKMEEFNINKSIYIPDVFLTIEELDARKIEIMDTLNIQGEIVYFNMDEISHMEDPRDLSAESLLEQRVEEEGYREIILFAPNESGNVTVIKLLSTNFMGEYETHFLVDIVDNKGYKEIVDISKKIEEIFGDYKAQWQTTINLTGAVVGKLTKAEEEQRQDRIFNFLQAKKIEVLKDELFSSVTAYSPLISSYIEYGDNKVNVQLAMRYSEYEDKTYIWIANPLITTTY
ncbi:YwmB family TATA-box binding protein [Alkaliphilus oremlandii]|uniref:TATA-box binding n=1 Tax=Alkaliphilus oremlandii (strain OhILAs) TaxID=350688 RepID=A8MJV5_ALKOO|nr:YwmB family TATA-box binding protein [Alkaliphilus oremlandii]ABW20087.1 hypothetical protein Clos_2556 [Alkaliphilus oremlandii OhILAs]